MKRSYRKFLPDEVFETFDEAKQTVEFLMSRYENPDGPLVYPIIIKNENICYGHVQMNPIENNEWEIEYHIGKKYAGKG